SHLLGGGRNAERFRFFLDEALCLIPAAGVRNRPVPVLHRAAPRPQAVRPPAPRLVRSGIYPSLVRRSPPERSFSLRTSRRGAAHGFKISTNGLEIQIVSAEADSAEVFVPAGILAPDYPANLSPANFCSAIRFPATRFPVHLFPVNLSR
ncbi:MAG: hypothetical protein ACLR3T_02560, partial [Alistipes finegoldii]